MYDFKESIIIQINYEYLSIYMEVNFNINVSKLKYNIII